MKRNKELRLWNKQFGNVREATDFSGRRIVRSEYATNSPYAWDIDHVLPESKGGKNDESNLICCHVDTNREKGSNFPGFTANGKYFKIRWKDGRYEIYPLDEDFFNAGFGTECWHNMCDEFEPETFVGYVGISGKFTDDYKDKNRDKLFKSFYQFVGKIFNTQITIESYSRSTGFVISVTDYNMPDTCNIQNMLNNCVLLNTYALYSKAISDNFKIDIYFGVYFYKAVNEVAGFRSKCDLIESGLTINDLVKINTDFKHTSLKTTYKGNYEYNYHYAKLKNDLQNK